MIKIVTQEYVKENLAVKTTVITFLRIPIFKSEETTTNNIVVNQLMPVKEPIKIKGF